MSTCPDDNVLVAYGSGALAPSEAQVLETHLDGCEICRTLAAEALKDDAAWAPDAFEGGQGDVGTELGPGAVLGRYVVLAALGSGGMGTVVSAYDPKLERRVAIKLLHAEARTSESAGSAQGRLLREAQVMARLAHPNVVSVFDVGTWGDRVFIAMEFVDGGTLRSWCAEAHRTPREILRALVDAGRGLAAAHSAGLVHRDFKPDNVLVSRDGRVLVTDFGLAHAQTGPGRPSLADAHAALQKLDPALGGLESTQAGMLVGTPAYMAPEQLIGRQADEKSDQFAFCATAWEALTGSRPFEIEALTQLAATLAASQRAPGSAITPSGRDAVGIPVVPPGARLPGYVHRALAKGLRLTAEERHADLASLLQTLSGDLSARRRTRWITAGLSVALVMGAGTWAWQWSDARALRCSGSAARFNAHWNPERQAVLRDRFTQEDPSRGPALFERISGLLSTRGEVWTRMHTEACEATRVRGEQSEEVLSLRMACLDRRLQDVDALVRLFETADPKLMDRAVEAMERLPPLEGCADVTALLAPVPLPTDPTARAKVERLAGRLADVRAGFLGGRYREVLPEARAAWEAARQLEHAPTRAEASTLLGMFLLRLGHGEEASAMLASAVLDSDRGRDDLRRAEAAIVEVANRIQKNRIDAADAQWKVAEAALDRLGTVTPLRGDLHLAKGRIEGVRGDAEAALASYRAAAERYTVSFGPDSLKRADALGNMADALQRLGRSEEAGTLLKASLAIRSRSVGDHHPSHLNHTFLLATIQSHAGQHDAAIETMERAAVLTRAFFPPPSRQWGWALDHQATVLQAANRMEAALGVYEASLDYKQEHFPSDDGDFYFSYDGIGQCLLALGRAGEALPNLERALTFVGEDPEFLADSSFALARALHALKREPKRVGALLDAASAAYADVPSPEKQQAVLSWRQENRRVSSVARSR